MDILTSFPTRLLRLYDRRASHGHTVTLGWPVPGPLFSFGILGPPRCEGFDDDDVVAPNVKL
jgi:hypothetical protein